jgi:ATP-dependent Clp protease ATP-binding subunit ClpA
MKELVLSEVKKTFNPEFLNRLDEIIVFKPLNEQDIKKIVDIMIKRLNERIEDKKITIRLTDEAKEFLAKEGFDPEYGARPLRRTIQKYIEDPLSMKLISGEIPEKVNVEVYLEGRDLRFRVIEEKEQVLV